MSTPRPLQHGPRPELDALRDWVVIYRTAHAGGGQWTAMTSRFGPLTGRRIIRGLERECEEYYGRDSG